MLTVTWTPPLTRKDKTPLDPAAILGYQLDMKVGGAPAFTTISPPGFNASSFQVDTNVPGDYQFQCFTITKEGLSLPASGSITIPAPALAPADPPQNFTITLS